MGADLVVQIREIITVKNIAKGGLIFWNKVGG